VKKPSLIKYLEFRLPEGDINNLETEHHSYIMELNTIAKHCAESPEIVQKVLEWKKNFMESSILFIVLRLTVLHCSVTNYLVKRCLAVGKSAVLLVSMQ